MASIYILLYVLMAFQQRFVFGQVTNVTTVTSVGTFIGFQEDVSVDNTVVQLSKFLGIPYAEPPTGQRRFQKPVVKAAMSDSLVTHNFGPECLQITMGPVSHPRSEDCLYLNIFSPVTPANAPLAVMIWIHGGGYMLGSANEYDPDLLAVRGNVIVVSMNYRLGAIGFLNLGSGHEGNFGLWDQQLAIQWVHNNIEAFGGDKSRVTIFGQSAGSGSVIYQGLYPGNRGLFQRIIAESGSASSPWSETMNYVDEANIFATAVGCRFKDPDEVLKCLKTVSVTTLNTALDDFNLMFRFPITYGPSVDGDFVKTSPKNTLNPYLAADSEARRTFATFDVLMGVNSVEGGINMYPDYGVPGNPEDFMPNMTFFENTLVPKLISTQGLDDDYSLTQQFLIQAFTNWSNPDDPYNIRLNYVDMHTDTSFVFPTLQTLDVHKLASGTTTYMYYFNIEPTVNVVPIPSWLKGSNHGDELRFVFGRNIVSQQTNNATNGYADWEIELSKTVITMWSNYAKTGNPNLPAATGTDWRPYSVTGREYLEIGHSVSEIATKEHLVADRYNLWTSLRQDVNKALVVKCSSHTSGTTPGSVSNFLNVLAAIILVQVLGEVFYT